MYIIASLFFQGSLATKKTNHNHNQNAHTKKANDTECYIIGSIGFLFSGRLCIRISACAYIRRLSGTLPGGLLGIDINVLNGRLILIVTSIIGTGSSTNGARRRLNLNVIGRTQLGAHLCHGIFVHTDGARRQTLLRLPHTQGRSLRAIGRFHNVCRGRCRLLHHKIFSIQWTNFPFTRVVGKTLCSLAGLLVRTIVKARDAVVGVPIFGTIGQTGLNQVSFGTIRRVLINGAINVGLLIALANPNGLKARQTGVLTMACKFSILGLHNVLHTVGTLCELIGIELLFFLVSLNLISKGGPLFFRDAIRSVILGQIFLQRRPPDFGHNLLVGSVQESVILNAGQLFQTGLRFVNLARAGPRTVGLCTDRPFCAMTTRLKHVKLVPLWQVFVCRVPNGSFAGRNTCRTGRVNQGVFATGIETPL